MPVDASPQTFETLTTLQRRDVGRSSTSFFAENIAKGVDWNTQTNEHTAILHLGGPITKLETQIEGRGGKVAGA